MRNNFKPNFNPSQTYNLTSYHYVRSQGFPCIHFAMDKKINVNLWIKLHSHILICTGKKNLLSFV